MHTRTINGVKHIWRVDDLWRLSEDLKVFELAPQDLIDLEWDGWFGGRAPSTGEMLAHMRRILEADLAFPVILDHDNTIMDGAHRVCRAILENRALIKVVRFMATPPPSETVFLDLFLADRSKQEQ